MKNVILTLCLTFLLNTVVVAESKSAVAVLIAKNESKVSGTITFTQEKDGLVNISGNISGLTPSSEHGFHIHEKGDCSSADGKSAGGHYNPEGTEHSGPEHEQRHVGDLGNISADKSGNATLNIKDKKIQLDGKKSVIGRAVIVHAGTDDLKSQPSGAAGPRIACGAIGIS